MASPFLRVALAVTGALGGACGGGSEDPADGDASTAIDAPGDGGSVPLPPEIDATFGDGGRDYIEEGATTVLRRVAVATDGTIVVAGTAIGPDAGVLACRYTPGGTRDTSWAGDGCLVSGTDAYTSDLVLTSAGVVVAGGDGATPTIFRYTNGGALDGAFGNGGRVSFAAPVASIQGLAADGTGVAVATFSSTRSIGVARIDGGGTVVDSGTSSVLGSATNLARRADGRFVLGAVDGVTSRIVDVSADLDTTTARDVPELVRNVTLQPDGALLVLYHDRLVRELPGGGADTSFGNGGTVQLGDAFAQWRSLAVLPDGRIAVAGSAPGGGAVVRRGTIWLYSPAGVLDTSFATAGILHLPPRPIDGLGFGPEALLDVAVAADGGLVVIGQMDDDATPPWGFVSRILPP